jgi:hypothetical protein
MEDTKYTTKDRHIQQLAKIPDYGFLIKHSSRLEAMDHSFKFDVLHTNDMNGMIYSILYGFESHLSDTKKEANSDDTLMDTFFDQYVEFAFDFLDTSHAVGMKHSPKDFLSLVNMLTYMYGISVKIMKPSSLTDHHIRTLDVMLAQMIAFADFCEMSADIVQQHSQTFANALRPLHTLANVRIRPTASTVPA